LAVLDVIKIRKSGECILLLPSQLALEPAKLLLNAFHLLVQGLTLLSVQGALKGLHRELAGQGTMNEV
jgi:hypothetical protein